MDHPSFAVLAAAAADPGAYALRWKERTGRPVIGFLPMNFPPELVAAGGALAYQLQEADEAITLGNSVFPTFYCGFTRSLVDQAMRGQLEVIDALLFVDNCVQIIGAADVVRAKRQDLHTRYFQIDPSMKVTGSSRDTAAYVYGQVRDEVAQLVGAPVTDESIAASIGLYNQGRALLREAHAMRRRSTRLSARDMQVLVKAGMVMERSEYNAHLAQVLEALRSAPAVPGAASAVRVHLSGHMCQAPKPALLDLIEECGAHIVNDDLYHGLRYFATDVQAPGDGVMSSLVDWYFERNGNVPCPTRTHNVVHWDKYLANKAQETAADGVITLLVKFCEPHMYQVPEINEALHRERIPHLLIETEHEGMPIESIRTRVESFVESIRSRRGRKPAATSLVKENA